MLRAITGYHIREHQPPVPSNHGSATPMPVTMGSPLVQALNDPFCKSCSALNDGVPKRAALLNGQVVAGALPTFVGAGHDPHPAMLAL